MATFISRLLDCLGSAGTRPLLVTSRKNPLAKEFLFRQGGEPIWQVDPQLAADALDSKTWQERHGDRPITDVYKRGADAFALPPLHFDGYIATPRLRARSRSLRRKLDRIRPDRVNWHPKGSRGLLRRPLPASNRPTIAGITPSKSSLGMKSYKVRFTWQQGEACAASSSISRTNRDAEAICAAGNGEATEISARRDGEGFDR